MTDSCIGCIYKHEKKQLITYFFSWLRSWRLFLVANPKNENERHVWRVACERKNEKNNVVLFACRVSAIRHITCILSSILLPNLRRALLLYPVRNVSRRLRSSLRARGDLAISFLLSLSLFLSLVLCSYHPAFHSLDLVRRIIKDKRDFLGHARRRVYSKNKGKKKEEGKTVDIMEAARTLLSRIRFSSSQTSTRLRRYIHIHTLYI